MTVSLPQNDSPNNQAARKSELERAQNAYQFDYDYLPPMPMIREVPRQEDFTTKYYAARAASVTELPANMLAVQAKSLFDPFDELEDFEDFFPLMPKPASIKTYRTDESFAEQRLSGANPQTIKRINALPEEFKVTNTHFRSVMGNDADLDRELQEGNIYMTDYSDLAFVKGGTYQRGRKYLPSPMALFAWRRSGYRDRGRLVPVAVQIMPTHDAANADKTPVFTPRDDSLRWFIAKLCVQIADANHHEMATHLCWTHLVMEPFGVVTGRQLSERHPLRVLLDQHFRFMLANNELGRQRLVNPTGIVEELLAGTLDESIQLVKNAYEDWNFTDHAFPNEIKKRGMDNRDQLPHYPFRDDGQLLWDAILEFTRNYVGVYYKTDADINADWELQAWAAELPDPQGGRVKGFPTIETKEDLAFVLTNIIFICGPLHGALNFSQYDYMAFVPNAPLAAYCPVPIHKDNLSEKDLMNFLPPPKQAASQLEVMTILTSYKYDRLGFYEDDAFDDDEVNRYVKGFQGDLFSAELRIEQRNSKRLVPYDFLKPSEILNSISI